jgi:hypothetical protein
MALTLDATVCSPTANSYCDLAGATAYFEADPTLNQTWSGLDQADQERLLVAATRSIDRATWQDRPLTEGNLGGLGLRQALAFPRGGHPLRFGRAAAGDAVTLSDPDLAGRRTWPDDYFQGGAAFFTGGANQGLIRAVTAFTAAQGRLTLAALPQAVVQGDEYVLLWPLEMSVRLACLEQAGWLARSGGEELAELANRGLASATVDGLSLTFKGRAGLELCARGRRLLSRHLPSGPKMERG